MDGLQSFVDGGIYVIVFLGAEPAKAHWGLYHHYKLDWVEARHNLKARYVPRGHKYHIRNIGGDGRFIPDHALTSSALSSMYLVGLMLIGIVPAQYQASLDSEIRSFDEFVSITPGINCQSWVMDTVQRLIDKGFLRNRYTRQEIESEIWQFVDHHWSDAWNATQPRPIERSRLFEFDS